MRIDQLATQSPATLQALKELLGVTQLDVFVAQLNYQANRIANLAAVPGPQGIQGDTGPQGVPGADGKSAYEVAVENGFTGTEAEWVELMLAPSLPDGGTAGQSLRKIDGTDGNAEWSSHWVVDPVTGKMSQRPADRAYADPQVVLFAVGGHKTAAPTSGVPGVFHRMPLFQVDDNANLKLTQEYSKNLAPVSVSTQTGNQNFQQGSKNTQSGVVNIQRAWDSTQAGSYNYQTGYSHTQSGNINFQSGYNNTQSGNYSFQLALKSTQSGFYGLQVGGGWSAPEALNDGGFDYTFMVGKGKTATVGDRAYFALNNGIWLKPFAGDTASPENGVLHYNSTLGKFRFYQGGGWKSYLTETDPAFKGVLRRDETATTAVPFATQQAPIFELKSRYINYAAAEKTSVIEFGARANLSMEASTTAGVKTSVQSGTHNIQVGASNTQSNYGNIQNAYDSTQSGYYNRQSGFDLTQSGYKNDQRGDASTQAGAYNTQSGWFNTQSGRYGLQSGTTLNDGGFDYTVMFGQSKTATVGKRAYFAMDNGIWLKPFAGDAASPENGVLHYNSTLGKFRAYEGGAWKNLTTDWQVTTGATYSKTALTYPQPATAFPADVTTWSADQKSLLQVTLPFLRRDGLDTLDEQWYALFSAGSNGSLTLGHGYLTLPTPTAAYSSVRIGRSITQSGYANYAHGWGNTQSGYYNHQHGPSNTQSGAYNLQGGGYNVQSGKYNFQYGSPNTQSGEYNTQSGYKNVQSGGYSNAQFGGTNTQSGHYGLQAGQALNDGGFDHTAMFGQTKTATVGHRAYFSMNNGIWLKPVATAPASPENGVIYYDSGTHKFRGYANGAWVDLH